MKPRLTGPALALCLLFAGSGQADAESLEDLVASGLLADAPNPVILEFLREEGRELVPPEVRDRAEEQLVAGLEEETLVRPLEGLDLPALIGRTIGDALENMVRPENVLRRVLGQPSRPRPGRGAAMRREVDSMLADPWVRGLEAARALGQAGRGESTRDFYRSCMQWTMAVEWLQERCTREVIRSLGARRAGGLFAEMLESPYLDLGIDFRALGAEPPEQEPVPAIEAAALKGFGHLLASGEQSAAERDGVLDTLLAFTEKKREDRLVVEAAVEALATSRDPRAVETLRQFAKGAKSGWFSRRPEVSAAVSLLARRSLALAFRDEWAIQRFRRELRRGDPSARFTAARVLILAGEPAGYEWAQRYLSRRSIPRDEGDFRPSLARALVHAGDDRARAILAGTLKRGHGSDWLEAWIAAGLVELGDRSAIPRLEPAVEQERWDLGRRAPGFWYRLLKPVVWEAAEIAAGLPSEDTAQVVLDFAFAARDRSIRRQAEQERRTSRLRWQIADSLGTVDAAAAVPLLVRLLEEDEESVRLSAVWALLAQTGPPAAAPKARALALGYGEEAGVPRSPEIRASILRNLARIHPDHPATARALAGADRFADPSVRFLALALRRSPSHASSLGEAPPEAALADLLPIAASPVEMEAARGTVTVVGAIEYASSDCDEEDRC